MSFTPLTFQGEVPTSDSLNRALIDLQMQIDTLNLSGSGTVTSVSVVTANGMSGTVATATTTPAITLVVGAINIATATGLPEAGLSLTNITTNNVSITKHGFAPILPNDATKYLDGTGAYTVPAAGASGITIGTTTITSGTTTRLLYDAAGVVGEISGATSNGTALTLVAPVLGTPASGTLTNCTGLPAAGVVGTAAILGANTFTALQTITQASANAGIIASTGYSLTGSNATNMLDFAGTWNTSGNPLMFKIAMTDTASGATTRFIELFAGAGGVTSVFNVAKNGTVTISGSGATWPAWRGANSSPPQMECVTGNEGGFANIKGSNFVVAGGRVTGASSTAIEIGVSVSGQVEINNGATGTYRDLKLRQLYPDFTNTATVGAVTINKSCGQCIMASGASTVVVTNSLVTANSQVLCTIAQNDTTATLKNVVATSGSFTITATAAATANCAINFLVLNQ